MLPNIGMMCVGSENDVSDGFGNKSTEHKEGKEDEDENMEGQEQKPDEGVGVDEVIVVPDRSKN